MEPQVTVRGRQADASLIQSVLPTSVQEYKNATGKDVVVQLDTDVYLSADSSGGVDLYSLKGRIRVSRVLFTFRLLLYVFIFRD